MDDPIRAFMPIANWTQEMRTWWIAGGHPNNMQRFRMWLFFVGHGMNPDDIYTAITRRWPDLKHSNDVKTQIHTLNKEYKERKPNRMNGWYFNVHNNHKTNLRGELIREDNKMPLPEAMQFVTVNGIKQAPFGKPRMPERTSIAEMNLRPDQRREMKRVRTIISGWDFNKRLKPQEIQQSKIDKEVETMEVQNAIDRREEQTSLIVDMDEGLINGERLRAYWERLWDEAHEGDPIRGYARRLWTASNEIPRSMRGFVQIPRAGSEGRAKKYWRVYRIERVE